MKYSFKKLLQIFILFFAANAFATPEGIFGKAYTDEFGPTQSNYSMGDFVRYTVTPASTISSGQDLGCNVYSGLVTIPGASDVYNYTSNQDNLYNFLGYLYAGYAALNVNPAHHVQIDWISFRVPGQITQAGSNSWIFGSLGYDNNYLGKLTNQLVDYSKIDPKAYMQTAVGGTFNNGLTEFGFFRSPEYAVSCTWNTNHHGSNYILGYKFPNSLGIYPWNVSPAPYGQFFGARIANILGAVVNDVPTAAESSAAATAVGTTAATWPNMTSGTTRPQMALLKGGPNTAVNCSGSSTAPSATSPVGCTTPSTAHFGTLKNYLTNLPSSISAVLKNSAANAYLMNHLLPVVTRFATGGVSNGGLCSYQISCSATQSQTNLISIISEDVTGYDNGVVVDVCNNTGDYLSIYQVTAQGKNFIGALSAGSNNYFLHTASLMDSSGPHSKNMIEIKDQKEQVSVFMQVMSAAQLNVLINALNTALNSAAGTSGNGFAYNQVESYAQPNNAQYVLITNFNPTTIVSTSALLSDLLMYRIQAVNIEEFNQQPYFMTLQINKENVAAGLKNGVMQSGEDTASILYPSILSVKNMLWQNPYNIVLNNQSYSSIPLILIPDAVKKKNIIGLQAHYEIWMSAYAAALTEFSFAQSKFGNHQDYLKNVFAMFDVVNQQPPARLIIDAQSNLASGQYLLLNKPKTETLQSSTDYCAVMGSDVWDVGSNFHQDIPVLNLYQNAAGETVGNQAGQEYINFVVNFETNSTDLAETFAQGYGSPYARSMFFSLATADLTANVHGELSQLTDGNYQLEFTDKNKNVLACQKVFIGQSASSISINFLNSADVGWTSKVVLQEKISSVAVGQSKFFVLNYKTSGNNNLLSVIAQRKKAKTATVKVPVEKIKSKALIPVASKTEKKKASTVKISLLQAKIERLNTKILKVNKDLNKAQIAQNLTKQDTFKKKLSKDKKKLLKLKKELQVAKVGQ